MGILFSVRKSQTVPTSLAALSWSTGKGRLHGRPACSGRPHNIHSQVCQGAAGKSSVAPLERVKILVQTGRSRDANVLHVLRCIYKSDGFSGFFRGNGANVARIAPHAALHFYFYDRFREKFTAALNAQPTAVPRGAAPVWIDLLAGSCSGAAAVSITYPLDLVRTRLAWSLEGHGSRFSSSILGTMRHILKQEGLRGLYQGMAPTLVGILPYSGIKFYIYQKLKRLWREANAASGLGHAPPVHCSLAFGGIAGLTAQTITYPLDVLRRRMQGLFRGVSINYLKAVPSTAIGFTVYDNMKSWLDLQNAL